MWGATVTIVDLLAVWPTSITPAAGKQRGHRFLIFRAEVMGTSGPLELGPSDFPRGAIAELGPSDFFGKRRSVQVGARAECEAPVLIVPGGSGGGGLHGRDGACARPSHFFITHCIALPPVPVAT